MVPGFWYAGKPIGLGVASVFDVIWKFVAASVLAGCTTALIMGVTPHFATIKGTSGAFVRMVSVSTVFFALYLLAVVALHGALKPVNDTIRRFGDLLPVKLFKRNP